MNQNVNHKFDQIKIPSIIKHYINDEFVHQENINSLINNINPAQNKIIGQISQATEENILNAISAAKEASVSWGKSSSDYRKNMLMKIAQLMEEDQEELAILESIDTGKPIKITRSVDIPRSIKNLRFFATILDHHHDEFFQTEQHTFNFTLRQPLGVVACISPWNLPLYLLTWKIAPALITGNSVIAKPSEITSLTAYKLAQICHQAGLPKGVLNILFGKGEPFGRIFSKSESVKAISFTGSTKTGRFLKELTSQSLKKISLEMGGKNPTIIFASADLEKAASETARAAFSNQGQICLCGSRIIVEKSIYDDFKNKLVAAIKKIKMGNPLDEQTEFGAVVSKDHFEKIKSYLSLARDKKYQFLCGGHPINNDALSGFYIEPTLIEGAHITCALNQDEIFGPIATIMPFEGLEECINLSNGTGYGLSASVWSNDQKINLELSQTLQAGMIWFNTWMNRDLRTHFGGLKDSGFHKEGGLSAIDFYTETKNICFQ